MRPLRIALTLALALAACEQITPEPAPRCVAMPGDPTPTASAVCENLSRLVCALDRCAAAYEDYRTRVSPEEFNRLTSCYARARSCDEVDQCERGCGPDGGPVRVGRPGSVDAGPLPDATLDAPDVIAPQDVMTIDAPVTDVPVTDVPVADVPTTDAPVTDVPEGDASSGADASDTADADG